MAYFATLGSAHKACLTDRKGREIIVQHKGVFFRAVQTFNQLCISNRTQRSNNQCLSLATRKQRRPVRFRQNAGFHFDGTNSRRIAAVDSWQPVKNAVAHSPLQVRQRHPIPSGRRPPSSLASASIACCLISPTASYRCIFSEILYASATARQSAQREHP